MRTQTLALSFASLAALAATNFACQGIPTIP